MNINVLQLHFVMVTKIESALKKNKKSLKLPASEKLVPIIAAQIYVLSQNVAIYGYILTFHS